MLVLDDGAGNVLDFAVGCYDEDTQEEVTEHMRLETSCPRNAAASGIPKKRLSLQDIELALEALEARSMLESRVRPDGMREYWIPNDAADTGIGPPECKPRGRR